MDSSTSQPAFLAKANRNFKINFILLFVDIFFNIILGIVGVVVFSANIETWAYIRFVVIGLGIVCLIDIVEIIVDFILMGDAEHVYIACDAKSVIINYPQEKKCLNIHFENITQIKKKHPADNLLGSLIKMMIGCCNVVITYRVDDKTVKTVAFGPISNCDDLITALTTAKSQAK